MLFLACDWLEGIYGLVWNYISVLLIMELMKMWQILLLSRNQSMGLVNFSCVCSLCNISKLANT